MHRHGQEKGTRAFHRDPIQNDVALRRALCGRAERQEEAHTEEREQIRDLEGNAEELEGSLNKV